MDHRTYAPFPHPARRFAAAACLALAGVACAAPGGVPADVPARLSVPAADSIAYVLLDPQRSLAECGSAAAQPICRVRRRWTAGELRARLSAGDAVFGEGDELTYVYAGDAEGVAVSGGIQGPLSRLAGTDLWVLTVRVARLDEAVVSYFFIPAVAGEAPRGRFVPRVWRGPRAPGAGDTGAGDAAGAPLGRVVHDSIRSRHLGAWRGITVYVPPARGAEPIAAVVFMADGEGAEGLGRHVGPLVSAGRLPRVLLVGMHADTTRGPRPEDDGRAAEYLAGYLDGDARFLAHERFVLDEVLPWAQAAYGVPVDAPCRAVFGFSNGAAFAVQMGLRHPDRFGRVLAFSPGGSRPALAAGTAVEGAAGFYLLGGTLEPAFHAKAVGWAALFGERGIRHVLREPVAGHDWEMWKAYFPDALAWAFAGEGSAC